MNSYVHSLKETSDFLEGLEINANVNALWDVLHIARWHKSIDWVRWIAEHKELVNKIAGYSDVSQMPDDLKEAMLTSMSVYKQIDR